eukprot:GHRQ01008030.1.p1 GENE.GHRQ01008030.1~~GHRQ01008030.1.p1  ORF type:complete len:156 (+),score=46.67 GHRQ01008030.1:159-626(+)
MAATGPINDLIAPEASATEKKFAAGHSLPSSSARFTPDNMPAGVARIVNGARKLFEVRTMQEHVDLMNGLLARDVTYDAPPILINNREDMRVAVYLAKSIATLTLQPALVSVSTASHWTLRQRRCQEQCSLVAAAFGATHLPIYLQLQCCYWHVR